MAAIKFGRQHLGVCKKQKIDLGCGINDGFVHRDTAAYYMGGNKELLLEGVWILERISIGGYGSVYQSYRSRCSLLVLEQKLQLFL